MAIFVDSVLQKNSVVLFVSPSEHQSLYTLLNKLGLLNLVLALYVLCLHEEV
jgi:hypothetical protein